MPRALGLALCFLGATPCAQEGTAPFRAFVWRAAWSGEQPPAELIEPLGGVNIEGAEPAPWLEASGWDFYVGHAPGRNDLYLSREDPRWSEPHDAWYASRDPGLLVREPCLSDPATRERLFAKLEATLRARGDELGLGLSMGDEVGLTPWGSPSDVCRSEHCEARWEAWCETQGLEPGPAPLTDEARAALEHGELDVVARWLQRRRFHQLLLLRLLAELDAHARELREQGGMRSPEGSCHPCLPSPRTP